MKSNTATYTFKRLALRAIRFLRWPRKSDATEVGGANSNGKAVLVAIFLSLLLPTVPAFAGTEADALNECLTDNTNGKERKVFVRWFILGVAAHPEFRDLASISPEEIKSIQKSTGLLITRLIGTDCKEQMRAAIKIDGPQSAMSLAMAHLGKIAATDLMSNSQVEATFMGIKEFINRAELDNAID